MSWDLFQNGWMLHCPDEQGKQPVVLGQFRALAHFWGTHSPPVYQLTWYCVHCDTNHKSLLTTEDLDLRPIHEFIPPVYDLATKQTQWTSDILQVSEKIKKGSWPLSLPCKQCAVQPAWPSLLRAIEPDQQATPTTYLVAHKCSLCEKHNISEQKAHSFHYPRV